MQHLDFVHISTILGKGDAWRKNMFERNAKNGVTVKAYRGDAMTLLAFNIEENLLKSNFVGFSIRYKTPSGHSYFLVNRINFEGDGALTESDKAPFQKFRWIHVPGTFHQNVTNPSYGLYKYFVTPRYWSAQNNALEPLDEDLTVEVDIDVDRYSDRSVGISFTRSFLTSQAFVRRFGENNNLIPTGNWLFDTSSVFCTNEGVKYTYEDVYGWLGYTARQKTIALLQEVLNNKSLSADMFAYDFDEPVVGKLCLQLAAEGRIRVILDNSTDHTGQNASETDFESTFNTAKQGAAAMFRGRFSRLCHHKVIIVKENGTPTKVLTGSTNFSVTGFCVNANHVVLFTNGEIAGLYEQVFEASWGAAKMKTFAHSQYAAKPFDVAGQNLPNISFTFSPHPDDVANQVLKGVADSITGAKSSVLFCIMSLDESSGGPVYPTLRSVQNNEGLFTYGITDSTKYISLYKPGSKKGILVNAKNLVKDLPPPFDKEETFNAHNIHHKFVVVDFNRPEAAVYFGSSNLALGGEESNGDNLVCVEDTDIATVFAIEAVRLVDHFEFRAKKTDSQGNDKVLKLDKTSGWALRYFDEKDIKYVDRNLFCD